MKLSNEIKIGVVFITAVLFLSAVVPLITLAHSANTQNINVIPQIKSINLSTATDAEKLAWQNQVIAQEGLANVTKNMTISKQMLTQIEAQANTAIQASVQKKYLEMKANGSIPEISNLSDISFNVQPTSSSTNSVQPAWTLSYIGTNAHDYGDSSWGSAMSWWSQAYTPAQNLIKNQVTSDPYGYGGANSWVWEGLTFTYTGPSEEGNVVMKGNYNGMVQGLIGGTSHTGIGLYVKDINTGTTTNTPDFFTIDSNMGENQISYPSSDFNTNIPEYFNHGDTYTVYVKINPDTYLYGEGDGNSDFLNGGGYGVTYSIITMQGP